MGNRAKTLITWVKSHPFKTFFGLVFVAFLFLNLLAYNHVYTMMHFVEKTESTDKPENLGFFTTPVGVMKKNM